MSMKNMSRSRQGGFAVPLAIVAVMLLLLVGTSLLTLGSNARIFSIRDTTEISARCAADAGLMNALYDMNTKLQAKPWDDTYLPSATNVTLPCCNATYDYIVTKVGGNYEINATGNCGNMQKKVQCMLAVDGPFDSAVFCKAGLWFANGSTVTQYHASVDAPSLAIGTNTTAKGYVQIAQNAQINGDVWVGAGGDPKKVIDNRGTITGNQYTLSTSQILQSVTAPSTTLFTSLSTLKGGETISSGKYTTDKINLGNSKTLTIKGDVTLYVTGDVLLGNSAQIIIDNTTQSSLTLYLGGNLSSDNGSSINNQTSDPRNMEILALDSCIKIDIKNSSAFYGTIYAPKAEITYFNNSALYGAIVGYSFALSNATPFYYDATLRNASVDDELVKFKVTKWKETQ
jgi:hypothetical protein